MRRYFVSPGGEKRRKEEKSSGVETIARRCHKYLRASPPAGGRGAVSPPVEDRGGPGLGAARAPGPRQGFPRSASLPAGDPLARGAAAVGDGRLPSPLLGPVYLKLTKLTKFIKWLIKWWINGPVWVYF